MIIMCWSSQDIGLFVLTLEAVGLLLGLTASWKCVKLKPEEREGVTLGTL